MPKYVETWRSVAYPWNCDSLGHMNTQFYAAAYDGASVHFLMRIAPPGELFKRRISCPLTKAVNRAFDLACTVHHRRQRICNSEPQIIVAVH